MKKFLLLLFSLAVGVILFLWIAQTVGWEGVQKAFKIFTGWEGLVVLGLTLLTIGISTWKWKAIIEAEGIKVRLSSLVGPYLASFSIMYFAPILIWGGELFRAYVLKERNGIPWQKGMASVIIDRILELTINLFVIVLGFIFFLFFIGVPPLKLTVFFGGTFLIFAFILAFFYLTCWKRGSIINFFVKNNGNKFVETEKEIFSFFKKNRSSLWKAVMLSFLKIGVMYVRAWFVILFLGKIISGFTVFSIFSFSCLAVMIPIPAALGSHEAIQTFAFNALGAEASVATAFTMTQRGAEMIVALLGVVIIFRLGLILIKNNFFKKIDNLVSKN
ncbi:MAG: lysylphosphatidylglycerol synthase transmembrane domain-containing protein [Candidatus Pacebacteria bacterium]|nr:lysylphosphatidylglycerol synthase transmembrane domain-containing protein [Candidatus Paceibacterota bacterium]